MEKNRSRIPFDVFAARCRSRASFEHILSRWGMLTLARLGQGPARFGELARAIDGISERMLSKTLKVLEEEGMVSRRDYGEKPPRVEYSLTDPGRRITLKLMDVIGQLYSELDRRYSS